MGPGVRFCWWVLSQRLTGLCVDADAVLLYGTFTFNGIIRPPKFLRPAEAGEEKRALLEGERDEER